MTTQEKLDKIYEVMADKTLSFGCKIYYEKQERNEIKTKLWYQKPIITERWEDTILGVSDWWDEFHEYYRGTLNDDLHIWPDEWRIGYSYEIADIIWHPLMIGDVLDWIEKLVIPVGRHSPYYYFSIVLDGRQEKRLPLNDQSDECIDFIYSLLPEDDK